MGGGRGVEEAFLREWVQLSPETGAAWVARNGFAALEVVWTDSSSSVLVIGGVTDDDSETMLNDVWESGDGRAWTLLPFDETFSPRAHFGAVAAPGGYVLVMGGEVGLPVRLVL
ncbi:hypothetical protein T484DRAFT_1778899, partial [Baffinella frigidus]